MALLTAYARFNAKKPGRRAVRAALFALCAAANLAAQEAAGAIWVIEAAEYHVDGRTRRDALERHAGVVPGTAFAGRAALEAALREREQYLLNTRVFSHARITYTAGEEQNGVIPVRLDVSAVDTFNIFVIPGYRYDSNRGMQIFARMFDNNFFGAMSPFKFDIGYVMTHNNADQKDNHGAFFALASSLPFTAFKHIWNVNIKSRMTLVPGTPAPFEANNSLGISLDFLIGHTVLTAGYDEGVVIQQKNETERVDRADGQMGEDPVLKKDVYAADAAPEVIDAWYLSSKPYLNWMLPTGARLFRDTEIKYDLYTAGKIAYAPGAHVSAANGGFALSVSQRLGYKKVDWSGNFRRGGLLYLVNDNVYNFEYTILNSSFSAVVTEHRGITPFFGVSARLMFKQWLGSGDAFLFQSSLEAGGVLRGIRDKALQADASLSLNLDFPFRVLDFKPSAWFDSRKFRYFDFEMLVSPTLDVALMDALSRYDAKPGAPAQKISFDIHDIFICAGLELLVFPAAWRSVYVRAGFAFNLKEAFQSGSLPSGDGREIFVGLGHHY